MAAFMVTFIFLLALTKAQNAPDDYLALHNRARAEVGVGPMQWSNTVATYGQAYAEKRKGDCAMIHSTGPYGENIAAGYYPEFTGADAVKLWANEKPLYDHASNKCVGGECGHYTQMVWRSSVRLGCARVPCKANSQFVVCNYDPPVFNTESISHQPIVVPSHPEEMPSAEMRKTSLRCFQRPNRENHDDGD
ncbi:basic form of pathogenesis-related protein 1-like [Cucurbita maxima]|uniref:Basic form of pathogenesis-related protein 1-like n=1 Tax=Cucurbita maxima TaxID=3661 RepID=A0A6J1IJP6_CUCMA|nr:basic form of pathogenesis-related protein 1-like [Cucurbita maxima]